MRERLEPLLLRMAMPSHTAESFIEFEASAQRVEAATSPGEFLERDHDFHRALMAGPTTIRLHDTVDHLWNLTHYYRRQLLAPNASPDAPDERTSSPTPHDPRAVIDGDVESAEAMLALHIATRLSPPPAGPGSSC